ncbi:MAG: hypothetical protein ACFFD1_09520 [Candidatus Thorarchaeota archaeon]
MASIDSKELDRLNKEISDLKEEISSLKKLLVPEISLSERELEELGKIQKDMEEGNEYSLDSLMDE